MRTIVTEFEKVIEELKKQNRLDKKALIEPNFYLSYEKLYKNVSGRNISGNSISIYHGASAQWQTGNP